MPYIVSFALGIASYRFRQWVKPTAPIALVAVLCSAVVMGLYLAAPHLVTNFWWFDALMLVSAVTAVLVATGTDQPALFRAVLCNPVMQFLGRISYGIYLAHYPILRWVVLPSIGVSPWTFYVTVAITIAVATPIYFALERPMQRLALWPASSAPRHVPITPER